MDDYLTEGRWYAELKRTKKYEVLFDWKTMLNRIITTYTGIDSVKPYLDNMLDELLPIIYDEDKMKSIIVYHYSLISKCSSI